MAAAWAVLDVLDGNGDPWKRNAPLMRGVPFLLSRFRQYC